MCRKRRPGLASGRASGHKTLPQEKLTPAQQGKMAVKTAVFVCLLHVSECWPIQDCNPSHINCFGSIDILCRAWFMIWSEYIAYPGSASQSPFGSNSLPNILDCIITAARRCRTQKGCRLDMQIMFPCFTLLPRHGVWMEVMFSLLSVCLCLFVCVQDISKSCGWIRTKSGGEVGCVTRTKWLDFGEDPNLDPIIFFLKWFFTIEWSG